MLKTWTLQKILAIDLEFPDFDPWTMKKRKRFTPRQMLNSLYNMLSDEGSMRDVLGLSYTKWHQICPCGCDGGFRHWHWDWITGNPYRQGGA